MSTLDDLRRTLESHSRELPLSDARTVAVHRRIRRIRRQRASAGAVAVVLVAGAGSLAVGVSEHASDQAATKTLPQYAAGGRLIGSLSLDASASASASTTVVSPSTTLILREDACTGPGATNGSLFVAFAVNGQDLGGGSCSSGSSTTTSPDLAPGQQATVKVWLAGNLDRLATPLTDDQRGAAKGTHVRVGIYAPVPRSQYVFPPRPTHLESLSEVGNPGTVLPQAGSATRVTNVDVIGGLKLEIDAVEPGVVTAELDGKVVGTSSTWAYGVQSQSFDLTPAQLAQLGIRSDQAQLTLHSTGFPDTANAWKAVLGSPVVGAQPLPGAAAP